MDLMRAAAVLGTEFTHGHIWQDKFLLTTFPVTLGEPSAALHVGVHSQLPPPADCGRPIP